MFSGPNQVPEKRPLNCRKKPALNGWEKDVFTALPELSSHVSRGDVKKNKSRLRYPVTVFFSCRQQRTRETRKKHVALSRIDYTMTGCTKSLSPPIWHKNVILNTFSIRMVTRILKMTCFCLCDTGIMVNRGGLSGVSPGWTKDMYPVAT